MERQLFCAPYRQLKNKKIRLLRRSLIEGKKIGEENSQAFLTNLRSMIKEIKSTKIDIVLQTAEDLIEEKISSDPHVIVYMTLKILRNIAEHTDVELAAHPKDLTIIKNSLPEITSAVSMARKISMIEDLSFRRGSIVIKANKSIVDAQIKTQLEKAKELMTNLIENKNGTPN